MGVHAVTEISLYWSVKHFLFKKISSSLHNVFSLFVLSLFKETFSWPRSGSQGCLTGQENIFYLQQVFFSFRPQSIQRDVFLTKIWLSGVNIYPKQCQYPGSETVWYKNVRQMDFYSPLIPSGGLKAEPMVNAAYEELFEARLGIATSNSMCLSLGKESCKSGRFFWWG